MQLTEEELAEYNDKKRSRIVDIADSMLKGSVYGGLAGLGIGGGYGAHKGIQLNKEYAAADPEYKQFISKIPQESLVPLGEAAIGGLKGASYGLGIGAVAGALKGVLSTDTQKENAKLLAGIVRKRYMRKSAAFKFPTSTINKERLAKFMLAGGGLGALTGFALGRKGKRLSSALATGVAGLGIGGGLAYLNDIAEYNAGGRYAEGHRPPALVADPKDPNPKEITVYIAGADEFPRQTPFSGGYIPPDTAVFRWGETPEIKSFIQDWRKTRPQDTINLQGHSMGGATAYEVARQLSDVPFNRLNMVDATNRFSPYYLKKDFAVPTNVAEFNNYITKKPAVFEEAGGRFGRIEGANNIEEDTNHSFSGIKGKHGEQLRLYL